MNETTFEYTVQTKGRNTDWEPVKLDVFGGTALLAITKDRGAAFAKMNALRSIDKTYHIDREYRIVKSTTTFEVLDD